MRRAHRRRDNEARFDFCLIREDCFADGVQKAHFSCPRRYCGPQCSRLLIVILPPGSAGLGEAVREALDIDGADAGFA